MFLPDMLTLPSKAMTSFGFITVVLTLAVVLICRRHFKKSVANCENEQPVERNVLHIKDAKNARSRTKAAKFDTSGVEEVTDATFQQKVLEGSRDYPVLVDFYANWCGPCRTLAPILEKISQQPEYKGRFHFTKINVDQNRVSASRHNVRSMLTLILFEYGRERRRVTGLQPPAVLDMLNSSLGR